MRRIPSNDFPDRVGERTLRPAGTETTPSISRASTRAASDLQPAPHRSSETRVSNRARVAPPTSTAVGSYGHPIRPGTLDQATARAVAARNVHDRQRAGEIPTHVAATVTLEGFHPQEARAIEASVGAVLRGLGAIFPPGHHRFTVEKASLADAVAETTTYGREAVVALDLGKHCHPVTGAIDTEALARVAQTLTHEIVLHARKSLEEYHLADRSPLDRSGDADHRDACAVGARDEYAESTRRVARELPAAQRAIFAQAWHDEVVAIADESLAGAANAQALRWAAACRAQMID